MELVVKEGIVVGDAVLLSCGDSAQLLKVGDVEGCQVRLDGEGRSVSFGQRYEQALDLLHEHRRAEHLKLGNESA